MDAVLFAVKLFSWIIGACVLILAGKAINDLIIEYINDRLGLDSGSHSVSHSGSYSGSDSDNDSDSGRSSSTGVTGDGGRYGG